MKFICFVFIFMKNKNDEDYGIKKTFFPQSWNVFPLFSRSWSELTDIRLNRVRVNEVKLYGILIKCSKVKQTDDFLRQTQQESHQLSASSPQNLIHGLLATLNPQPNLL